MKNSRKVITGTIVVLLMLVGSAFGGSKIEGAVINKSKAKNSANIAIGKNNSANMGSTSIQNSEVKGAVINKSKVKNSANIAIGENNSANMGSVEIQ